MDLTLDMKEIKLNKMNKKNIIKTSVFIILIIFSKNLHSQYDNNIYSITRNGKKGFVDNNLEIIIEPSYDEIGGPKETFFGNYSIITKDEKYGLIDKKGKIVLKPKYERLSYTKSPNILRLTKDKAYGLINTKGKSILKPIYDYGIEVINEGQHIIVNKNEKFALFDIKGNQITDFVYDRLRGKYHQNLIAFSIKDKWGYINEKGEVIIKPLYDYANSFDENHARVVLDKKDYLINKKGEKFTGLLVDQISSYQYSFNNDHKLLDLNSKMYYVKKDNKIGLVNDKLQVIVEPNYDEISNFNEGYAYVKKDNKYGYINIQGNLIIPLMYDDAEYFSEGLAPVVKDGKWGAIDINNDVKIDFKFKGYLNPFFDGLAVYRKREYPSNKGYYTNDKCGYINIKGEVVIEPIYRNAKRFINGAAIVEDKDLTYLMNKDFKKINLSKSEAPVIEMVE
jgi:hypothetical protein